MEIAIPITKDTTATEAVPEEEEWARTELEYSANEMMHLQEITNHISSSSSRPFPLTSSQSSLA